jgi:plastocyanin
MAPTYDDRVRAPLAAAAVLLGLAVLTPQAHAATKTVTLTANGPSPATLTLARGDRVQFLNADNAQHRVKSEGSWQYDSGTLAAGASSPLTPPLFKATTYRYVDTRSLVIPLASYEGSLVIKAPPPTASPTPSPTRSSAPSPTPSATPSAAPASTPAAPATPSATPVLGCCTPGTVTSPTPSPVPSRTVAPPSPAPEIRYGAQRALIQGSPHRYGLPVLIGAVGVGGVASLIVRFLLTMAPASRRTEHG